MKKRIVLILVGSALLSAAAQAWEHPANPDRFPSIGFSLQGYGTRSDVTVPSAPGAGKQESEDAIAFLILDTRLPLSDSFTLDLAIGSVGVKGTSQTTSAFLGTDVEGSGGYFRIGGRFYFNGGPKGRDEF